MEAKNINEAAERIRERVEAPVLSTQQAAVFNSDYINNADEVLALLENADQDKSVAVPGHLSGNGSPD